VNIYFHALQIGSYMGWHGESRDGRHFYTTDTDPHGPTAALQPGDEVIAINGVHPAQDMSVLTWFDRVPPGTPFSITVLRNGQVLNFSSKTAPFPPGKRQYNSSDLTFQFVCLLFLTTGLAVLLLKPDNRQAWLLALMLGTFVGVWSSSYPYSALPPVVELLVGLAKTIAFWFFPLFLIFFLNFPERSPLLQRFPRLEPWLYVPLFLFIRPTPLAARLPAAWVELVPGYMWWLRHGAGIWMMVAILIYVVAGLLCLIANYRAASPESRKRLRVAMAGSSAGFFTLLLQVIEATFGLRQWKSWQPISGWLQTITLYALPLIPLSFAYAIVRHKVIPVSLIIRRSVRYLLVSRGSILLEMLIVSALLWLLLDSFFQWLDLSSRRVVGVVSAVVAIVAWHSIHWVHRRWLAPLIDRRFFRTAYDAQQILTELAQSVRTTTNVKRLLELVAERMMMKALPLGGLASYQYQQKHLSLAASDVVLLLSDGLPERFNPAGEMLDYDLVKRGFAEAAVHSPQQIIEHLIELGETWANGHAQDDDVTFVALKVK
jgi:phosphoserine phosphatase RsbU/P